jgi:hypothetical protein
LNHQQLRTVAEVFNPGCFSKQVLKHQLIPGRVFDIELGSDLRQHEVIRYLKSVRPGVVTIVVHIHIGLHERNEKVDSSKVSAWLGFAMTWQ